MNNKPDSTEFEEKISEINHEFNNIDSTLGLNEDQVNKSKEKYGKNTLVSKKPVSFFVKFLKQLLDPLVILLLISAIISLGLAINFTVDSSGASEATVEIATMFVEVGVILLIVFGNAIFGVIQDGKTEKTLNTLKNMSSTIAKVIRNGKLIEIDSENVLVGDILSIDAGDKIVADCKILDSSALEVNESLLTGETLPVQKSDDEIADNITSLAEQTNRLFSGTNVTNGRAIAQVYAIGMKTEMGKIASLIDNEDEYMSPLQKQIHNLSKYIGIGVVAICIISWFVYIGILSVGANGSMWDNWDKALNNSIALAIASVPEGLLAIVMVILANSVKYMARKGAIVKKLPLVETLGSASVICSDKTGTLTKNKMTVFKTWNVEQPDLTEDLKSNKELLTLGTLCTDGIVNIKEDGETELIGDPTETSIVEALQKLNITKGDLSKEYERVEELPFDSDRKLMSVILKTKNKYLVVTKGAPDQILSIIKKDTNKKVIDKSNELNSYLGNNGLRVLGVAHKWLDTLPKEIDFKTIESDLTFNGLIGIMDPIRPEAKLAIEKCIGAGIKPIMITGDHKNTASYIAKQLGILNDSSEVISGSELALMTDEEFSEKVENYSVYARVNPEDKIRIVKMWQSKEKIVSMTGDGVNDAPSLKAADIGCAMGITGTEVSKDAADMILTDDNFSTIVEAVAQGRRVLQNIKNTIMLLLTTNLSCLLTIFIGMIVFGINLLSSLQILWINIVSETLPGIALGVNKSRENFMVFKPRHMNANIVDKKMLIKISLLSVFITIFSLLSFYIGLGTSLSHSSNLEASMNAFNIGWIWHNISQTAPNNVHSLTYVGEIKTASSMTFMTLGLCLSSNAISFRTTGSVFAEKFKDQMNVIGSFLISYVTLALVTYVPKVDEVFNMSTIKHLGSSTWVLVVPYLFALGVFLIQELIKFSKPENRQRILKTFNIKNNINV